MLAVLEISVRGVVKMYKCEKCGGQVIKGVAQCKITKYRKVPMEEGRFREEIESEKLVCPKCSKLDKVKRDKEKSKKKKKR